MGVFQIVNNMPRDSKFNLTSFWTRSLGCGIIAKYLAHCMNKPKMIEEAFIVGFMHDIGQAVLAAIFPDEYAEISKLDSETEILEIYKTEKAILGTDHTKAGEFMAQKWNLPNGLVKAIAHHHRPDLESDNSQKNDDLLLKLVYLADRWYHYVMFTEHDLESMESIRELTVRLLHVGGKILDDLPDICRRQINEIAQDFEIDINEKFSKKDLVEKDVIEIRQQLSRKDVQLAYLQNATEALIEAKSNEEILQIICEAVYRGLQMGRVILFEYNSRWDSFVGKVGFGLGLQKEIQALNFSIKTGLFKYIKEKGDFISIVGDNLEIYGSLVTADEVKRLDLQAFAAIPIKILNEVQYVIITDSHDKNTPIDDETLRSIISLANQAAMSLERNLLRAMLEESKSFIPK
jgi:hypothetical protein